VSTGGPAFLSLRLTVPLRSRDLDSFGHVNQSVYHELLEEGRTALLREIGRRGEPNFVLARVELDHCRELLLTDGDPVVELRVTEVRRSSFAMEHDILAASGAIAASGRSVLVGWDPNARASRPLTDAEREQLAAIYQR
jgi:acyl-CoA thioester hydrolase